VFKENPSFTDRLKEALKPTPMKRRIEFTIQKLRLQSSRLDKTLSQLETRDHTLHEKCVKALETRDTSTATLYANECVQLRKLARTALSSQICLEQALLRLETIEHFGDMVQGMSQVKGIIRLVRTKLEGRLPELSTGLGDVEDSLAGLTLEVGEAVDIEGASVVASDESARILKEADMMAEQKMKERFPEIPQMARDAGRVR